MKNKIKNFKKLVSDDKNKISDEMANFITERSDLLLKDLKDDVTRIKNNLDNFFRITINLLLVLITACYYIYSNKTDNILLFFLFPFTVFVLLSFLIELLSKPREIGGLGANPTWFSGEENYLIAKKKDLAKIKCFLLVHIIQDIEKTEEFIDNKTKNLKWMKRFISWGFIISLFLFLSAIFFRKIFWLICCKLYN